MPELPEVESVRRTLRKATLGVGVESVDLRRQDVVDGPQTPAALLVGHKIVDVIRHGKQLAILGTIESDNSTDGTPTGAGPQVVCIHLGMTGSVRVGGDESEFERGHVHVVWKLENGKVMGFRDPRRFGGIWTFSSIGALRATRWAALGPDALEITEEKLAGGLKETIRAVKAALLDQTIVAGLGNIYVDEVLFRCGIHPMTPGRKIKARSVAHLWREIGAVLGEAIHAGGSSVRDYVDASGTQGGFQLRHRVYGRAGLPCVVCGSELKSAIVGGRTTVFCVTCQTKPR